MKWIMTPHRKLKLVYEGYMAGVEPPQNPPSTCVIYVLPQVPELKKVSLDWAQRFVDTYRIHPPLIDHETLIVLNKGTFEFALEEMFAPIKNVRFLIHDDSGWDIGAFQMAAKRTDAELLVFFGTSIYLNGDGWLERMVIAYKRHGDALYGAMGNKGIKLMPRRSDVYPHVRTTGFWMKRETFNKYPVIITGKEQRYEFEHGKTCLGEWMKTQDKLTWVISFNGDYLWKDWDDIPNGYGRGDQSAILCGDKLTEGQFFKPKPHEKDSGILPRAVLQGEPGQRTTAVAA